MSERNCGGNGGPEPNNSPADVRQQQPQRESAGPVSDVSHVAPRFQALSLHPSSSPAPAPAPVPPIIGVAAATAVAAPPPPTYLGTGKAVRSGRAIDVVCILSANGTLHATPFCVRFSGESRKCRHRGETIRVLVNGVFLAFMRLQPGGHCAFVSDSGGGNGHGGNGKQTAAPVTCKRCDSARLTKLMSQTTLRVYNRLRFEHACGKCIRFVEASFILWDAGDSLFVSDIDGTITRTDVKDGFRSIMAAKLGRKAHGGTAHAGTCRLFRRLVRRLNCRVLYLSARPLSWVDETRMYIQTLAQTSAATAAVAAESQDNDAVGSSGKNGDVKSPREEEVRASPPVLQSMSRVVEESNTISKTGRAGGGKSPPGESTACASIGAHIVSHNGGGSGLPFGPIFTTTEGILGAFTQELLKRSAVFKVRMLNDLRCAFKEAGRDERKSPIFIAGFGNRATDVKAYVEAGIPSATIFTIGTDSRVHAGTGTDLSMSYSDPRLEERIEMVVEMMKSGNLPLPPAASAV